MKIGVCIPCYYGHVNYIERMLASISDQSRLPDIVAISISGYPKDIGPISYSGNFSVRFIQTSDHKNAAENRNIAARAIINEVDVLYHEATFLDSEEALAGKTMHSTAKEAATIALKANVKQLVLGHYSTRYENIELFKEQAETIFPNVLLADDGKSFEF